MNEYEDYTDEAAQEVENEWKDLSVFFPFRRDDDDNIIYYDNRLSREPRKFYRNNTGRNQECHCGSGRKYKKCCLRRDRAAEDAGAGEGTVG